MNLTYCIDEEEHSHEHTNVRQSFEALHKGVEQNSDTDRPPQKLNESGSTEKLQKTHGDHFGGVYDAANHSYEIKGVPRVFEVVLENNQKVQFSKIILKTGMVLTMLLWYIWVLH